MREFARLDRLPPYVFATVNKIKMNARHAGNDIIDLGMGNPDLGTPAHIVEKLMEASQKPHNHRYSASMGITKLRMAIASWYKRRFDVDIDPDTEAIVTIGVKEGMSHLILVTIRPGDVVFTPTPTYPIHPYSAIIAGGDVRGIPLGPDSAKEHDIMIIHDFAYADLVFDGYKAPSFLQVKGAKDVGVEFYSLSKSYSMPVTACPAGGSVFVLGIRKRWRPCGE